jgi:hypothetical protein
LGRLLNVAIIAVPAALAAINMNASTYTRPTFSGVSFAVVYRTVFIHSVFNFLTPDLEWFLSNFSIATSGCAA